MDKLRVLQLSFIAVISIVCVEGIIGILVSSLAILSDAAHAVFDAVTIAILFLTTRMSLRPPDEEHTYGHAKIESIGGMIGGLVLLVLVVVLLVEAWRRITSGALQIHPEPIGFVAVFYTLSVDAFRIRITSKAAASGGTSMTVRATMFDALADFTSTTIALIGFGLASLHYPSGDTFAAIAVSMFLIYLSANLLRASYRELIDTVPGDVAEKMKEEVLKVENVIRCRELKVRRIGEKYFVEITVTAPESMSLKEAHDLTAKIEQRITGAFGECSVTIHVEPEEQEDSRIRQASGEK
jgi:cation diffusion facilitator family transporter